MSEAGVRVLVVESNAEEREHYKGILAGEASERGFDLQEAASGKEGLKICRAEQPGCVVMGDKLADMDAARFLDELSDEAGRVATPVVVVLTQRSRKAVNTIMGCGATDWLFKDETDSLLGRVVGYAVERRATEKRLGEQRVLFKAFLTGVPGFLVLKNKELRYEAANPAFCQFLGKSPDEIVGQTDQNLFSKKDAKVLQDEDNKAMRSGIPHTDVQEVSAQGGSRWLEIARSLLIDDTGETTGLLWSARDITAFKQMEDTVGENQEFYLAFAKDQTELTCRLNPDSTFAFVNEPLCQFFGRDRQALLGQSFLSVLPEAGQEVVKKHLAALTKKNPVATLELAAVTAGGDQRHQEWTTRALFADDGNLEAYLAVGRDITAARQAEHALAEHQQRLKELEQRADEADKHAAEIDQLLGEKDTQLQQLSEQVKELEKGIQDNELRLTEALNLFPLPFCELGKDTHVVFFNQAGLEAFGYTQKEVSAGLNLVDLFHPDDKKQATESLAKTVQGKTVEPGEYRMLLKDGSETTVRLICGPILQKGQIAGLRCCLVNLVDRQSMEHALAAAAQMATAATHATSLARNVNDLMVTALQNMAQSDAKMTGPDSAKIEELQDVLQKVGAFVQQMRMHLE